MMKMSLLLTKIMNNFKNNILLLLILIFNLTILNANEPIEINVKASCSDTRKEEFSITLSSNKLHLTKDAIQNNIDGYVDVPEDSYYLKNNKNDLYKLDGVVENLNENKINKFTSYIDNNSEIFINIEEFNNLKDSKYLKFIQKINLQKSNYIKVSTLDVYFDKSLFNKEYKNCEKQIKESTNNLYLKAILLISFIFVLSYLLKRNFKKKEVNKSL